MVATQTERNAEIVRLRKTGLSPAEIGKIVGVTRATVSGIVFRSGLTVPRAPTTKKSPHTDTILRMHGEGKTAPEMSAVTKLTDSSVRRVLAKLGLKPHRPPNPMKGTAQTKTGTTRATSARKQAPLVLPDLIWLPLEGHPGKPIEALTRRTCRWPLGSNDFTFCCAPCGEEAVYCPGHARIAYAPPKTTANQFQRSLRRHYA